MSSEDERQIAGPCGKIFACGKLANLRNIENGLQSSPNAARRFRLRRPNRSKDLEDVIQFHLGHHHPHIHMIVPGSGLLPDGTRWVSSRPAILLRFRVLGKLFRRPVPHPADGAARGGAARVLRQSRGTRLPRRVHASPVTGSEEALSGLRQAAVRQTRDGARVPAALHPPNRYLEQPADPPRRQRRHLPLQGLPPRRG